jgi:putative zinc finger/helix-turn-helix YgiT family protein
MVHPECPAEQELRCPTCNAGWLHDKIITDRFEYEVDGKTKTVVAEGVPVRECDNPECRERLSGPEAGRIRHEAICRAFRLLTPREIQAIREKLGPSQERFAQLTGIGVATISRWERGRLLQNRAMDNYLRLVALSEENVRFLEGLQAPEPACATLRPQLADAFRTSKVREMAKQATSPPWTPFPPGVN